MKLESLKKSKTYNKLKYLGRKSRKSTRNIVVTTDIAEKELFESIDNDSSLNTSISKSTSSKTKQTTTVSIPLPTRKITSSEVSFSPSTSPSLSLSLSPSPTPKYVESLTSKNTLVPTEKVKKPFFKREKNKISLVGLLSGESTGSKKEDFIWSIIFYSTCAFCGIGFLGLLAYCITMTIDALVLFAS